MNLFFKEWLILNEIGHTRLPKVFKLPLPDQRGRPISVPVLYCDPQFELYHPIGTRWDDETGETREYDWKDMVKLGGIGWEGLIPFTNNLFFSCKPRETCAIIGNCRGLIRVPDNWFEYALFSDGESVTYCSSMGIFGKTHNQKFSLRK